MINLIPNQEKKKKVKDFCFRLGVVSLASLGFSAFIAALALLPSFYVSFTEQRLAYERLEAQKNEPVPIVDQDSLNTMEELNRKIVLVNQSEQNKYLVSQKVIDRVLDQRMADIKITSIGYENVPNQGKLISIYGIAPSRERLLLFRRALEGDPAFKKVDLPISNFIKGSNIQFFLTLVPV